MIVFGFKELWETVILYSVFNQWMIEKKGCLFYTEDTMIKKKVNHDINIP